MCVCVCRERLNKEIERKNSQFFINKKRKKRSVTAKEKKKREEKNKCHQIVVFDRVNP